MVSKKTKVSLEQITHFNCGECRKWWSVSEAPKSQTKWFCPWCGVKQWGDKLFG